MFKVTTVNLLDELAAEAKKWLWVREEKGNKGSAVERFQKAIDGRANGEPWCAGFAGFCVKEVETRFSVKSGLTLSEHVLTMWNQNPEARASYPEVGFIAIWRLAGTVSGHCGIVTEIDPKGEFFMAIEGNTSGMKGMDRDGEGVWLKQRTLKPIGSFKLLGFLQPWKQGGKTNGK